SPFSLPAPPPGRGKFLHSFAPSLLHFFQQTASLQNRNDLAGSPVALCHARSPSKSGTLLVLAGGSARSHFWRTDAGAAVMPRRRRRREDVVEMRNPVLADHPEETVLQVTARLGLEDLEYRVRELSADGFAISPLRPLAPGSVVHVSFQL